MSHLDRVRVLKDDGNCPKLPIVEADGSAWAVVWPGVGAELRSMHHISLQAMGRTVRMNHPTEAVYYVMKGTATAIDPDDGSRHDLIEGSMAHVEPGTPYLFEAGADGAEIIGGPCPADHTMYAHIEN
jgi:quercetin dioxygenase-like cupin family protein